MACIKTQHEAKEKKVLFYIVILSLVLVRVVSCLHLLFSGSAVVWFKESPAEAKKTLIIINHKCKKEKRKNKTMKHWKEIRWRRVQVEPQASCGLEVCEGEGASLTSVSDFSFDIFLWVPLSVCLF